MMLMMAKEEITEDFIIKVHDVLLEQIDVRKGYRMHDIRIVGSTFDVSPARYVKTDMALLLKWVGQNKALHPFVKAVLFHHKFERIHPFADGNGRTGRMLMNYMLVKEGYPPCIIQKKKRQEYIKALRHADHADLFAQAPKLYRSLVQFVAEEYVYGYWNIFLT
jgi:Fic family protein